MGVPGMTVFAGAVCERMRQRWAPSGRGRLDGDRGQRGRADGGDLGAAGEGSAMKVALDATYALSAEPTGIAVYSQRLIEELAALRPDDRFSALLPQQSLVAGATNAPTVSQLFPSAAVDRAGAATFSMA
jgi:hypothetical protein